MGIHKLMVDKSWWLQRFLLFFLTVYGYTTASLSQGGGGKFVLCVYKLQPTNPTHSANNVHSYFKNRRKMCFLIDYLFKLTNKTISQKLDVFL